MMQAQEYWQAKALLEWQLELGASEAIGDLALDRYALDAAAPDAAPQAKVAAVAPAATVSATPGNLEPDDGVAVAVAEAAAAGAQTLEDLSEAMAAYEFCDLRKGARNLVFADGNPAARVMVIGEAPGRDEDQEGRPFVGRAGQLLDKMFAAIGLSRSAEVGDLALYISNVVVWRPPQNREPSPHELAMMLPFLRKHVELANPEVLVCMGNTPCQAVLGRKGITRMRGEWAEAFGRPVLPMFHPAYLLRNPIAKREAWADLLSLKARLGGA